MRWLEAESRSQVPSAVKIVLARKAVEKHPNDPKSYARLGDALADCDQFRDAAEAYEAAARQAPADFQAWPRLAKCYLELDLVDAALDACRRGEEGGPSADIHFQRGRALRKSGRVADAQQAFLQAVRMRDMHIDALLELFRSMVRNPDGAELLEFCEGLSQSYKDTALVRSHRAIALSRVGRTEEALQLVDLKRHVARVPFSPPARFGGIEEFNRQLANDILADRSPGKTRQGDSDTNYAPQFDGSPTLLALREFIKSAIESYLTEAHDRGLDAIMPAPPTEGTFFASTTTLRDDGHNGEHVHARGYVSTVYYVLVPDSVTQADDERGALAIGRCEDYTGGYVPCWGTRFMKPVAGSLVVFPSHIFHDVVPSRSEEPRIAVAADLRPAASAGSGARDDG